MEKEAKVKCAWCAKEAVPKVHKEKSEYGKTVTWTCSLCEKLWRVIWTKKAILEKVRTFSGWGRFVHRGKAVKRFVQ
jgi:hypothetical protein